MKIFALISLLVGFSCATSLAQRESVELSTGWKFIKQEVTPDAAFDAWESVSLPHTWNALDGQNGKTNDPSMPDGYYRGPGWYAKKLDVPPAWKGRRVFIRFEAASLVADVWLNGKQLGEHRGGFTAFCFELTPGLKFDGENVLRVRVDNSRQDDIPPQRGDFTVCGGLYRPVHLLITDQTCISPLDYASPGVYLTERKVSASRAVVEIETKLSSALPASASVRVEVQLHDSAGKPILTRQTKNKISPGATISSKQTLTISQPHLWNGRKDPYLYSVDVRLWRDGAMVDEVTQPLGLRTVQVDQQRGFLLNGQPYPIHGVTRHQERRDKGWALSEADHDEDHRLILDIGATAIRLAHYPQSDYFAGLCDHSGLLLWEEIPVVDRVNDTPAFRANARQQLLEMIHQGYNHPAISFWGLFNELYQDSKTDPPEALIGELKKLAKGIDPTRVNVSASDKIVRTNLNLIPDWVAFNIYPYWYPSSPKSFAATVEDLSQSLGNKRIAISEYGAGANIKQHEEGEIQQSKTKSAWHPEEWQAIVHERDWAQIKDNPHLWGTFLWNMFDFASANRDEGGNPGVNDKGIITEDRKVKKDAFFFYQANWTDQPMVHITSQRMTPRKLADTEVKVYSNCEQVELKLNGQSIGVAKPDDIKICRWEGVQLHPGINHVEAVGRVNGGQITDTCEWVLEPVTVH
jgi:beta-galactosidase